jgi:PEGA domain
VLTSDETGKFGAPNLNPGNYSVRVSRDGFDDVVAAVELKGTAELALSLTIAQQKTSVNVTEKNSAFANSDAGYRRLRDIGLGDTYRLENFTLNMDLGTFQFKSGTITFLALVDRVETGAIFVGQGHFTLQPADDINKRELLRRSGAASAEEDFSEAVFRFTGNQYVRFTEGLGARTEMPPEAAAAFARWKEKVRHRHEFPE